jgi:hypothetical protein
VGAALLDGEPPAGLDEAWPPAREAHARERAAARRLDLLDRALVAYDPEVFARAKLWGALVAAAAVVLLALVLWLTL